MLEYGHVVDGVGQFEFPVYGVDAFIAVVMDWEMSAYIGIGVEWRKSTYGLLWSSQKV